MNSPQEISNATVLDIEEKITDKEYKTIQDILKQHMTKN